MPRTFNSKVSRATVETNSVRTTIPETVATIIGAEPGVTLAWEVDAVARAATVKVAPLDAAAKEYEKSIETRFGPKRTRRR